MARIARIFYYRDARYNEHKRTKYDNQVRRLVCIQIKSDQLRKKSKLETIVDRGMTKYFLT